jgi:hypothetical protein
MRQRPSAGGWSVRQLDRQISTLAYQRTGAPQRAEESGPALKIPEAQIKDPFVLEFLGLKDEYSEAELEEALIRELEQFLLELGNDSPTSSNFWLAFATLTLIHDIKQLKGSTESHLKLQLSTALGLLEDFVCDFREPNWPESFPGITFRAK